MLSNRSPRAQQLSVSSLLKGISWTKRVSNLVGHSFCEHIGKPGGRSTNWATKTDDQATLPEVDLVGKDWRSELTTPEDH